MICQSQNMWQMWPISIADDMIFTKPTKNANTAVIGSKNMAEKTQNVKSGFEETDFSFNA